MGDPTQDQQGYIDDPLQMPYNFQQYQQVPMIDGNMMMAPTTQPLPPPFSIPAQMSQPPYLTMPPPPQQQQQQTPLSHHLHLQHNLRNFWRKQLRDVVDTRDFKNHSLPLARVKKIMKADEDVRMIAAEAPVLFARACEIFILELTLRSWAHTEESKRRTLQKNDIAAAIKRTQTLDFLADLVPEEEVKDGAGGSGSADAGRANEQMPYFYVPPQHQGVVPSGMMPPMNPTSIMLQQQLGDVQQQGWQQELQGQIGQQEQLNQEQPPPPPSPPQFRSDF